MPKIKEKNINPLLESFAIHLYDMSINDVEVRKDKRLFFETGTAAANFLGYVPNKFYERVGVGRYVAHKGTGVKYAARKTVVVK